MPFDRSTSKTDRERLDAADVEANLDHECLSSPVTIVLTVWGLMFLGLGLVLVYA